MLRALVLTIAAAGAIGIATSATPANARIAVGPTAPAVESNKVDVRCWHNRHSSRWHCRNRHHYVQPYYQPYYQPFYVQPYWGHGYHHRRHHPHH
ncbi:MAG: hypothetical protein K2P86_10050 [Xanthobacteraceae bacterium]|nr:hypothetical protein [Xanthobacteraceae bacterium]